MILHLSGWITVLGLAYTTALYLMNMINPLQDDSRVFVHCMIGKFTFVSMLVHMATVPSLGFNQIPIWSAVGLIFLTVGTGVVLSYLPDAKNIRFHARSIHPALVVGIAVAAIHHILLTSNLLG